MLSDQVLFSDVGLWVEKGTCVFVEGMTFLVTCPLPLYYNHALVEMKTSYLWVRKGLLCRGSDLNGLL